MDNAIHRINLYLVDGAVGFPYTHPLDSTLGARAFFFSFLIHDSSRRSCESSHGLFYLGILRTDLWSQGSWIVIYPVNSAIQRLNNRGQPFLLISFQSGKRLSFFALDKRYTELKYSQA